MNGIEVYVLYAEKMTELEAVINNLAEHGSDVIGQLHSAKLERQTADMAAWMQEHFIDFRKTQPEATAESIGRLLTSFLRDDGLSPPDAADFWWCQGLTPPWAAQSDQDRSAATEKEGKLSLRDLRNGSQEQDKRKEHQKAKSHDIER
jgi:hypothetical protein